MTSPVDAGHRFEHVSKLCERPGCSEPGAAAYGMVPEDLLFWLAPLADAPTPDPNVLCRRHADAMVVPERLDARRPSRASNRDCSSRACRPRPRSRRRRATSREDAEPASRRSAEPEQLQIDGTGEIPRPRASRGACRARRLPGVAARLRQRRRSRRPARSVEPAAGARLPRHRAPPALRTIAGAHVRVGRGAGATRRRVPVHVARLEAYPAWLRLVHDVELVAEEPEPTWDVELRARVGPFARSKRLRMERSRASSPTVGSRFERAEVDGREHAMWALRVELEPDRRRHAC